MSLGRRKKRDIIVTEILLIFISLVIFAPVLLGFIMSFMPPEEVYTFPPKIFPSKLYWKIISKRSTWSILKECF